MQRGTHEHVIVSDRRSGQRMPMNDLAAMRLATVEDDPRFRHSLALLLRNLPGFVVVASHASAAPLLAAARKARELGMPMPWDLVITDLGLPEISGVELTRELKTLFPQLRVIVLSVFEDPINVLAAICAGADGYLLKGVTGDEMVAKLEQIRQGQSPLSTALAGTLMRLVRESHKNAFSNASLPRDLGLSARQLDVLRGLVDGLSYREIGERHDIATDTVRNHIRQIYSTLQVHNVAEAVSYALRHGLA
jgi:DNA-binding NarL/FixJ family response regulator